MTGTPQRTLISVEDYLAGELTSSVKHEYIDGFVYAMSGARNLHNIISGNVFASLHVRLRGKPCRPFNSDTKIRIQLPTQVRFYYPEISVVCRPNSVYESFQDEPVVIIEVLSENTRRVDEGEKKDAFLKIPSLRAYVLIEQEMAAAMVYRRHQSGFLREDFGGLDAIIPLPEIETELPFAEVYEGADLTPETVCDGGREEISAALKLKLMSVDEYLASELASPIKREYLEGVVYAMAGAPIQHNRIASNTLQAMANRTDGKRCEAFNSDQKIRIRMKNRVRFYYPEVSVICLSNPSGEQFQDHPVSIFEVLSDSTRRADEGEKKDGYLSIPSLKHYFLIEQHAPIVVVFRRKGRQFVREVFEGLDAIVPLPEIGTELPLAEIYKRVEFIS